LSPNLIRSVAREFAGDKRFIDAGVTVEQVELVALAIQGALPSGSPAWLIPVLVLGVLQKMIASNERRL